jgi:hypothetical protein
MGSKVAKYSTLHLRRMTLMRKLVHKGGGAFRPFATEQSAPKIHLCPLFPKKQTLIVLAKYFAF